MWLHYYKYSLVVAIIGIGRARNKAIIPTLLYKEYQSTSHCCASFHKACEEIKLNKIGPRETFKQGLEFIIATT